LQLDRGEFVAQSITLWASLLRKFFRCCDASSDGGFVLGTANEGMGGWRGGGGFLRETIRCFSKL